MNVKKKVFELEKITKERKHHPAVSMGLVSIPVIKKPSNEMREVHRSNSNNQLNIINRRNSGSELNADIKCVDKPLLSMTGFNIGFSTGRMNQTFKSKPHFDIVLP